VVSVETRYCRRLLLPRAYMQRICLLGVLKFYLKDKQYLVQGRYKKVDSLPV
jgi:hypothetical protein